MAVWAEGSLENASRIYYEGTWFVYRLTPYGVGLAPTIFDVPPNARVIGTINIPSESWFKTTEAKLHLLDCSGLSHYRLIYESKPVFGPMGFQETIYKQIFNQKYAEKFGLKPVNVTTSGYVKIFERVKGAKIYGKANASVVTVEVKVKTNQGRVFTYSNVANVVNGTYEIIVPYAQDTTYPVKAITPYTIKAGNVTKTFSLSDEDVENGKEIRIDLV
jgi:dolichyl-diphosphooligosaccharide--protein glycosyltransferase